MKPLAIWPASAVWRRNLIVWAALALAILVLYRETGLAMATIWYRSGTFAHAFLVPPISIWLAWRQRHVLAAIVPKPALWVLLPMAMTALAWLAGQVVAVNSVTQLALVGLLVLSVPLVWGLAAARALMFPLAFLFFSAPVGEFLLPVLMQWTADFTVAALRLTGVPVYREGLRFIIPSGSWSVVEACSGVRYLIASFMVGSLFGYLNYRSNKRRWIFVGVSILVPIVANWVRASSSLLSASTFRATAAGEKSSMLSNVISTAILPSPVSEFGTVNCTLGFIDLRRSSKLSTSIVRALRSATAGSSSDDLPDKSASTPMTKGSWIFFSDP